MRRLKRFALLILLVTTVSASAQEPHTSLVSTEQDTLVVILKHERGNGFLRGRADHSKRDMMQWRMQL